MYVKKRNGAVGDTTGTTELSTTNARKSHVGDKS